MNYSGIKWLDTANGPGSRISLFVSGCPHHCPGCFNSEMWEYDYGAAFTSSIEDQLVAALQQPSIDGLSLLGGEPFAPRNQVTLYLFLRKLRKQLPGINIWVYSGYTVEQLLDGVQPMSQQLLEQCDVLVDGRFVKELRDIKLRYRGSSNQHIVDVPATLKSKAVVLTNEGDL